MKTNIDNSFNSYYNLYTMASVPQYVFENLARKIYVSLQAKRKQMIEGFMKGEWARKAAAILSKRPVVQAETFLSLWLAESVYLLREKIWLPATRYETRICVSSVWGLRKSINTHIESEYVQKLPTLVSQRDIQEDIVTRYYMDKNIKDAFDDIELEYLSKLA